jgi:hypothetical protein
VCFFFVFRSVPKINSNYFLVQQYLIGFNNEDGICLLRHTRT